MIRKAGEGNGKEASQAAAPAPAPPAQEKEKHPGSEVAELTATLQRLQADFDNYKKYVEKEKQRWQHEALRGFVKELLPTLDAFELAIKNTGGNGAGADRSAGATDQEKLLKGMELLYAQFMSVLQAKGLKPVEALGKHVDPYRHEVLLQETRDDCGDGMITEELQKGYLLNDAVIRTSKVKVCRAAKEQAAQENAEGQERQAVGRERQAGHGQQAEPQATSPKAEHGHAASPQAWREQHAAPEGTEHREQQQRARLQPAQQASAAGTTQQKAGSQAGAKP